MKPIKMEEDDCNLKWCNYFDCLQEMLQDIRGSNKFTDVTLVCDDNRQIEAHKIVLCASSPVFKDIINNHTEGHPVIYLQDILFQELEAILEFIYLGIATFEKGRIAEFVNAARNLEIKELSNTCNTMVFGEVDISKNESKLPPTEILFDTIKTIKEEATISNKDSLCESNSFVVPDQTETTVTEESDKVINCSQIKPNKKVRHKDKFLCNECHYQTPRSANLKIHMKSIHEGVRYSCGQCDYRAKRPEHLVTHTKTKHLGIKYDCNECDYQATRKDHLKSHTKSVHEGIRHKCDHCDYRATQINNLKSHMQAKHEGQLFPCDLCSYTVVWKKYLLKHKKLEHSSK